MVVGTRACAAEKRSGPSLSACAGLPLHLTPDRSGTARESKERGLQKYEIPASNTRENPPEVPGHKLSSKHGSVDIGHFAAQDIIFNI